MKSNLTGQAMGGFVWKFLEKFASQGMQLIIQIILARLLLPEEYGLVGLLTIFITISDTFILQGLTTALIQKKNPDEKDFSSVFFSNIAISLLLYAILFISAPLVAEFYKEEQLTGMMRVLSLNVIIGAFPAVHNAILSRALDFKKSFFRNIANVLTQGIVGIFLAYQGFGAWAMVYSKTAGVFVGAVVLCFTVKWHPRKIYSIKRVKSLFSFSSKVLGTNLLNTIFNNIHSLIIGRFYTTESLGYYQRGQQIPQAVMSSFDGSMTEVLYPVFSKVQSDFARLKKALRKSIKTSMYITLPILMGLLVTAKPLTLFLLTEKWLPSVPFMQLACIICMFWPLSHRTHALNAIGKSNVTLKISLISKGITLALIFACLPFGIYAIMLGSIGASIISFFITSFFINKYLQYSLKEICLDLLPIILLAGGMGTIVYCVNFLKLNSLLTLAIQIPLGITIYVAGSIIFKFESFYYLLNIIKGLLKTKKEKEETEMKKILILGGSKYILPVIDAIHKLGYYAITCDYLPNNIAHKYSDEYHNISILEKDQILKLAIELKIDGIMSFACDPGVETAAYVAQKLELPSVGSYEAVSILQNKIKFREFLTQNGFNVPRAMGYFDAKEAETDAEKFCFPIIIKPADSAGSKGVTRVDTVKDIQRAAEYAKSFSKTKMFIMEEFIEKDGYSSDTDSFSVNGKLIFCSFNNQYFDNEAENPYTPAAYSWPSTMPADIQELLRSEIQRLIALLNLDTSIYNIETRLGKNGKPYIMEVSPRGGGNRLAEILRYATNTDLITNSVRAAVGEEIIGIEQDPIYFEKWAEIILHSKIDGIFERLEIDSEFEKKFVVEKDIWIQKGDFVHSFTDASHAIGTLILKFNSQERLEYYVSNIDNFYKIVLH